MPKQHQHPLLIPRKVANKPYLHLLKWNHQVVDVPMKKNLQEAAGVSTDEDERDGSTKAAATIKHAAKANT